MFLFLFWVEKTAGSFGVCVRPYNRTDRFNSSPYYALKTVLVIVNYTRVKTISVDSQKKKKRCQVFCSDCVFTFKNILRFVFFFFPLLLLSIVGFSSSFFGAMNHCVFSHISAPYVISRVQSVILFFLHGNDFSFKEKKLKGFLLFPRNTIFYDIKAADAPAVF